MEGIESPENSASDSGAPETPKSWRGRPRKVAAEGVPEAEPTKKPVKRARKTVAKKAESEPAEEAPAPVVPVPAAAAEDDIDDLVFTRPGAKKAAAKVSEAKVVELARAAMEPETPPRKSIPRAEEAQPQHIAVHRGHAFHAPVVRGLGNATVQVRLVLQHAIHQRQAKRPGFRLRQPPLDEFKPQAGVPAWSEVLLVKGL